MTDRARYLSLGAGDFLRYVQSLLPPGPAWSRDDDTALTSVATSIANALAGQHQRTLQLSEQESDPRTTVALLPEWERAFGLPDPCTPLNATLEQRRAALLAKMTATGGQSIPYYVSVAAALGFPVTITEFRPFRVGRDRCGAGINGPGWGFTWQVNAPSVSSSYFRVGRSVMGEPLRAWGNAQLECVIRRIAPAHTQVLFSYGGVPAVAVPGGTGWSPGPGTTGGTTTGVTGTGTTGTGTGGPATPPSSGSTVDPLDRFILDTDRIA